MKHIREYPVTDDVLVSSSVPETVGLWNPDTDYTLGDVVRRDTTHVLYENLIPGVDATYPENALSGDTPRWLDAGPTNKWAMFDPAVNTLTSAAGTIQNVYEYGSINALAFIEIEAETVRVQMEVDSQSVYDQTFSLKGYEITGWYDWFFARRSERKKSLTVFDLPRHIENTITVTISNGASTVTCGGQVGGVVTNLGETQKQGFRIGIRDYSVKETDAFGRIRLVERDFSKFVKCSTKFLSHRNEAVFEYLASVRATLGVFIPGEQGFYEHTIVYGYLVDFVHNEGDDAPTATTCNMEIEGVT